MEDKKGNSNKILKFYDFVYSRKSVFILLFIFGFIVFEGIINEKITDYIVDPFFSHLEKGNTIIDIVVIVSALIILFFYSVRFAKNYIQHNLVNILISLVGIILFYYRKGEPYFKETPTWEYVQFEWSFFKNHNIVYLDVLLWLFILNTILIIINYYYRFINKRNKINQSLFLTDGLWKKERKDLLSRKGAAEFLATEVKRIHTETSFAIGIVGEWGSGKTYFLEMVKEKLAQEKRIVTIDFNPWRSKSPDLIVEDFFNTLDSHLAPYSARISNKLKKYGEQLSELDKTGIVNVSKFFLWGEESLKESYDEINHAIEELGYKIVVVIDDIDRLHNKEIIEVLRLIRNTANFYNTIFIAAYDKRYVHKAIKDGINGYNSQFYLEKVIQVEIPIPLILNNFLKDKVIEILEQKLIDETKTEDQKLKSEINNAIKKTYPFTAASIFDDKYKRNILFDEYIKTIRDVYRICNSIIYSYSQIKREISFDDFWHIELIKLKCLEIYNGVKEKVIIKKQFIKNSEETIMKEFYVFDSDAFDQYVKNIENIYPSKEILKETLSTIFPSIYPVNTQSIVIPSYFPIYFSNQLFENISQVEFQKYRKRPFEEFKSKMDDWINHGKSDELITLFTNSTDYDDKNDFEQITNGLRYLFTKELIEDKVLINRLENDNLKKVRKLYSDGEQDLDTFIRNLFVENSVDFVRDSQLLSNVIRNYIYKKIEGYEYEFVLTLKDVQNLVLKFLDDYLKNKKQVDFSIAFSLYYCCIEKIEPASSSIILLEGANRIFKEYIEKNPEGYFEQLIRKYNSMDEDKLYVLEPFISQTFGNLKGDYKEFKKFISNVVSENPRILEVRKFFKVYEENNFEPIYYVPVEDLVHEFNDKVPPSRLPDNNDDIFPRIFDLNIYNLKIKIRPEDTRYWRLGFVFSRNEQFPPIDIKRHQDPKFPYIHLCIGTRNTSGKWENPNTLEPTHYNIDSDKITLIEDKFPKMLNYKGEEIELQLSIKNKDLEFSVSIDGVVRGYRRYSFVDFRYCKLAAWSDGNEFKLSTVISIVDRRFL